jgi:hypothetical protein
MIACDSVRVSTPAGEHRRAWAVTEKDNWNRRSDTAFMMGSFYASSFKSKSAGSAKSSQDR